MHRQRVVGPINKAIITFVEKRVAQLLNNDILLAAVFVDPQTWSCYTRDSQPFFSRLPQPSFLTWNLPPVFCLLTSAVEKCTNVEKINAKYENICLKNVVTAKYTQKYWYFCLLVATNLLKSVKLLINKIKFTSRIGKIHPRLRTPVLNEDQKIRAKQALRRLAMKIKGLESPTSQSEFTDQRNIEADHHSSSSIEVQDFNKHVAKVGKDKMKERRLDVNEPLNVKLRKFKQPFH